MVWNTIDSSVGRLRLTIRVAWLWLLDKLRPAGLKSNPSPLKSFTITKGT